MNDSLTTTAVIAIVSGATPPSAACMGGTSTSDRLTPIAVRTMPGTNWLANSGMMASATCNRVLAYTSANSPMLALAKVAGSRCKAPGPSARRRAERVEQRHGVVVDLAAHPVGGQRQHDADGDQLDGERQRLLLDLRKRLQQAEDHADHRGHDDRGHRQHQHEQQALAQEAGEIGLGHGEGPQT